MDIFGQRQKDSHFSPALQRLFFVPCGGGGAPLLTFQRKANGCNNQLDLTLVDVRPETDFNLFHLVDAQHVSLAQLDDSWSKRLSENAVVVVMSNDEQSAVQAWKRLAVQRLNAYVLAGGVNRWLDLYHDHTANVPGPDHPAGGDDALRHRFDSALGCRVAEAKPDAQHAPPREFQPKLKLRKAVRAAGGGCG